MIALQSIQPLRIFDNRKEKLEETRGATHYV